MRNKAEAIQFFLCVMIAGNISISSSRASTRNDSVCVDDTVRTQVQLYFRWDKHVIDSSYMSNRTSLTKLEELLSHKRLRAIDSIKIKAYASPEGPPLYNLRLSERRGNEAKKVLLWKFPQLDRDRIVFQGMGENWDGLRQVVEDDPAVPSRLKVLQLLDLPLSLVERDKRLQAMDGGVPYRYIFNKYYRQLRNASSIYLSIIPRPQADMPHMRFNLPLGLEPAAMPALIPIAQESPSYRYIRPLAVKSNLLFDVAGVPNIELELPIGKSFSLMGEWMFPWWGGLGNRGGVAPLPTYTEQFTMQMLSGGLEARYWFPRGERLDRKARQWGDFNPLTGWFVGIYGGAGLYDLQFRGDGIQGEFYIASGVSGGFAHPIGKYFHMEYSLGIGYLATRYYRYTPLDGHKVVIVRPDGRHDQRQQSWLGPTKAKISLVWIPRFKVKNK